MKLRALVIVAASIQRLLRHFGEPVEAPVLAPARGPPSSRLAQCAAGSASSGRSLPRPRCSTRDPLRSSARVCPWPASIVPSTDGAPFHRLHSTPRHRDFPPRRIHISLPTEPASRVRCLPVRRPPIVRVTALVRAMERLAGVS
jgi:hypothetical protein